MTAPRAGIFMLGAPWWSDPGTVTAVNEKIGFPASNLQLQRPTDRWIDDDITQIMSVNINAGSAKSFNAVSMMASNASSGASWRVRTADTEGELITNPSEDTARYGPCLRFDGSTNWFAVIGAPTAFSVEGWIRLQTDTSNRIIWSISGGAAVPVLSTNASSKLQWDNSASPGDGLCTSTTTIVAGTWYHVSATHAGGAMELIVNGISEGSNTGTTWTAGVVFNVAPNVGDQFIGDINQLRIWNIKRSAAAVLADYATVLSPPVTNLIHYWDMEEGTGNLTANAVGGGPILFAGFGTATWCFDAQFWSATDYPDYVKTSSLYVNTPVGITARYMQIDMLDMLNPDGEFRVGRLVVAAAPQFTLGLQYGSAMGVEDTTRTNVAPSGLESIAPGVRRRVYDMSLRMFNDYDASRLLELMETRGSLYDMIFIQDPTATTRERQFLMQCKFSNTRGLIQNSAYSTRDSRLSITEMV